MIGRFSSTVSSAVSTTRRSRGLALALPLLVLGCLGLGLGAGLGLLGCGSDTDAEAQSLSTEVSREVEIAPGSTPETPGPQPAATNAGARPAVVTTPTAEGSTESPVPSTLPASRDASSPSTTVPAPAAAVLTASGFVSTSREGHLPGELLQLPESVEQVIVIDASNYEMYLYRHKGGELLADGDFFVAIGKGGRLKLREGDEKTPIGVYDVVSYLPGNTLPEIYGVGALPLDYPNRWDRLQGRTGSGIWIHGTDKTDEGLEAMSSRGCLTLRNPDFEFVHERVEIRGTPVVIADGIDWVSPETLEQRRQELLATVDRWRADWESRDTDDYLSHYSRDFRGGSMNLAAWSAHKRRVNSAKTYIEIGIADLMAFDYPGEDDLVLVTFRQSYGSNNYNRQTRKRQFWRQEDGEWRILYEESI